MEVNKHEGDSTEKWALKRFMQELICSVILDIYLECYESFKRFFFSFRKIMTYIKFISTFSVGAQKIDYAKFPGNITEFSRLSLLYQVRRLLLIQRPTFEWELSTESWIRHLEMYDRISHYWFNCIMEALIHKPYYIITLFIIYILITTRLSILMIQHSSYIP